MISNAAHSQCDACGEVWGNHKGCQKPDTAPGPYFVSVTDGSRYHLAAGPFPTHQEALDAVDTARRITAEHEPKSVWWGWGTVRMAPDCTLTGVLNRAGLWPPKVTA